MKKIVIIILCILYLISCKKDENKIFKGTISISGAWALYPLVVKWAEEYQKINKNIQIDLSAGGAGKGMADTLSGIVDIGMISREIYKEELDKGAYPIAVAKDAVVPTINENNPFFNIFKKKGIKKNILISLWTEDKYKYWNDIINNNERKEKYIINVYTRSDACGAAQIWAKYLGFNQEDLLGIGVYGDPGIVETIKKDAYGLGYNNINYVYDTSSKKCIPGIKVLPIDLNNNDMIDKEEDFYNTRNEIINAIINDNYPSPPARLLYLVILKEQKKIIVYNFLEWILNEGQNYVYETGYIKLNKDYLIEQSNKIKKK